MCERVHQVYTHVGVYGMCIYVYAFSSAYGMVRLPWKYVFSQYVQLLCGVCMFLCVYECAWSVCVLVYVCIREGGECCCVYLSERENGNCVCFSMWVD